MGSCTVFLAVSFLHALFLQKPTNLGPGLDDIFLGLGPAPSHALPACSLAFKEEELRYPEETHVN